MMRLFLVLLFLGGCISSRKDEQALWIYTSMYKDTIADLTRELEKDFPGVKFNWYQAGSEEIASKVNAELMAGSIKADILISSDRFWYEDLATSGKLHAYQSTNAANVPSDLRNSQNFYAAYALPVMVLCYNNEMIKNEQDVPKTFLEMVEAKWKDKYTTGSPLASGTSFTTLAFLVEKYGWDHILALRKNNTISEGGNSGVIRRLQNGERAVGQVLLENVLRLVKQDKRLVTIYPKDGVIFNANIMAIVKKEGSTELKERFVDWMYTKKGQDAAIRSYMYSPLPGYQAPEGALPMEELRNSSFKWSDEFLKKTMTGRNSIKEQFTKIMFE